MKGFIIATLSVLSLCVFGRQKPTMTPYIETDGVASYMDLGFVPQEPFAFDIGFRFVENSNTGNQALQGCGTAVLARYAIRLIKNETPNKVGIGSPPETLFDNNLYSRHDISYSQNELVVDGRTLQWTPTTPATKRLGIGRISAETSSQYGQCRVYYARYYQGGVLIRDLVPYSGPRGVGLLDRVNDVLYANANTSGTLTYGVEGGGIPKAPYIKTSGTTNSFWYMPYSRVGFDKSVATPVTVKIDVKVDGVNDNVSNYILGAPVGLGTSNFGYFLKNDSFEFRANRLGTSPTQTGSIIVTDYVNVYKRNTYIFGRGSDVGVEINGESVIAPSSTSIKFIRYGFALGGNPTNTEAIETVSDPSMITVYGYEFSTNGVLLGKFKPAQKDGVAGMTNELNGDFYPASNCIYGEESEAVMLGGVGKIEMPKTPF